MQGSALETRGPRSRPEGFRCDFCGNVVPRVQRVALDGDYERLRTPHPVKYACPPCSDAKERSRLGLRPTESAGAQRADGERRPGKPGR